MAKTMSIKQILKKEFVVLDFAGEWEEKYGRPEQNFRAMFYGPAKSGKSTECLKFCQYLADHFGRVLYNSFEEGISKTLQDRIIENHITTNKITFADRMLFDEMIEKAKKGRYRTVVIDSLQYMGFTYAQYKQFVDQCPKKSLIIISQVNGRGSIKGGTDLLHAVDMTAYFNAGHLTVKGRFRKGVYETQLFGVKRSKQTKLNF